MSKDVDAKPVAASDISVTDRSLRSNSPPSFRNTFNAELSVQYQMRVQESDIPALYKFIDTNGDGNVDFKELSCFMLGRYDVAESALIEIFKKFDRDISGRISLAEFTELITEMNNLLKHFDSEEISTLTKFGEDLGSNSAFACFCCPCTCGVSLYLAHKASTKLNDDLNVFITTKKQRLDKDVQEKLSYSLGATFLHVHAPSVKE